jgi:hypothetical protein
VQTDIEYLRRLADENAYEVLEMKLAFDFGEDGEVVFEGKNKC